jgi:hypothetical protein
VNDPALSKKDTGDFPALGTEFPSLGAAKEKKKKKQTMSLADFQSSGSGGRSSGRSYGDLPMGPRRFDINSLPTGPRVRGPGEEEDGPPMGGGFRGYGGDRDMDRRPSRYGDDRDRDDRRGPPRDRDDRDEMMPSRADEVDNWGAERKFVPSGDRGERRGGFGGGGGGGYREDRGFGGGFRDDREFGERRDRGPPTEREPSRADEVDNWGAERKFVPSGDREERRGFGGGFREERGFGERREERGFGERREGSFGRPPSRADEVDRWGGRQADDDGSERRERPRLKLKPRTKPVGESTKTKADEAIFGGAKPVDGAAKAADDVAKEVEEKLEV